MKIGTMIGTDGIRLIILGADVEIPIPTILGVQAHSESHRLRRLVKPKGPNFADMRCVFNPGYAFMLAL